MKRAAIAVLRVYQWGISPWLPRACRFYPTCSQYAIDAVGRFGVRRGGGMALRRLSRCHPFHAGGYDPVPEAPDHLDAQPMRDTRHRRAGVRAS